MHKSRGFIYYFTDIWRIIDIINFMGFLCSFILRIMWFVHPQRTGIRVTTNRYPELEELSLLYVIDIQVAGVNTIITIFKTLRFFSLSDKLNVVIATIERAAISLVSTLIMLLICVLAFSFTGQLLFGFDNYEFKDFVSTISATLRHLTGDDINYEVMNIVEPQLWPVFFILFTVIGDFLIMNFFEAVLMDSFGDVSESTLDEAFIPNEENIKKYIDVVKSEVTKRDIRSLFRGYTKDHATSKTHVEDISTRFDHGDIEIMERLAQYQEDIKGGQPLFKEDLRAALGPEAKPSLIDRIFKRLDADGSGTIEMSELYDPETKKFKLLDLEDEDTKSRRWNNKLEQVEVKLHELITLLQDNKAALARPKK